MTVRVLEAAAVGVLAGRILEHASHATVIAAFERSFYLDLGGQLIAVVAPALHDGPLTIRLNVATEAGTGQRWIASPARLQREDGLTIDLTTAPIWTPDRPRTPPHRGRLRRGLDHLLECLRERHLPDEGLLGLVVGDRQAKNAVERAAVVPIDALREHLPRRLASAAADPPPIAGLLGLGPGLTPSGDDLLCGVLIACRHLGADAAADDLARHILEAAAATTPISRAHLAAAAEGYAAAPLHDLLHAMSTPSHRGLRQALDAAGEIGHSSGLDAIAGMVLALVAWLQADKMPNMA